MIPSLRIQVTGCDLVRIGFLLSPAVLSELPPLKKVSIGSGGQQVERKEGFNCRLQTGVCVWVFCDRQPLPLLFSRAHTRTAGTRRPFGLWYYWTLAAAAVQRGRLRRCTWANINILHEETLMCGGQSSGSAPLSGLSPECRVNSRVGRCLRADGSDVRSDERAVTF